MCICQKKTPICYSSSEKTAAVCFYGCTWFGHFWYVCVLLIGHESESREDGKTSNKTGSTVQKAQVYTIPADTQRKAQPIRHLAPKNFLALPVSMLSKQEKFEHLPLQCIFELCEIYYKNFNYMCLIPGLRFFVFIKKMA